jgi:hypothetical protein
VAPDHERKQGDEHKPEADLETSSTKGWNIITTPPMIPPIKINADQKGAGRNLSYSFLPTT